MNDSLPGSVPGTIPADAVVTCDKLVDLSPTWAAFGGWTILFDPLDIDGDLFRQTATDANADSIARLDDLAGRYAAAQRGRGTFAALPAGTYHITVVDGVNDRHAQRHGARAASLVVPAAARERFRSAISGVLEPARSELTFTVTGVEIRGHAVVAALSTEADLGALADRRRELLDQVGVAIGVDLVTPWRPHITLGYLANVDDPAADRAAGRQAWASVQAEIDDVGPLTYHTATASLYGFTDMVTYRRLDARG